MAIPIEIRPLGRRLEGREGDSLRDLLIQAGVEFPCGGRGRCRGCRVRVVKGSLEETPADLEQLGRRERRDGWRLACQARLRGPLILEVRQLETVILADDRPFDFVPGRGLGVAVDVGTTTLVAQLVDLGAGTVLATSTALNPQTKWGADVMTRITHAMEGEGLAAQRDAIRGEIQNMVKSLLRSAGRKPDDLCRVDLVGNSVMHHLFVGLPVDALAVSPFEASLEPALLRPAGLGWRGLKKEVEISFLPNLGSFVGSDVLAVFLATQFAETAEWAAGADLGTNGEVFLGRLGKIYVASTAAGPAFEGGRISMGMRAGAGAIDQVTPGDGGLSVHVIGGGEPKGLCGSGLVDAVACALESGDILPTGRLKSGSSWTVAGPVAVSQKDVRELQLAKGAVRAGLQILMEKAGVDASAVARFYLAGAFGNSLSAASANRIGLFPFDPSIVAPVGNAALRGAKMCLFSPVGGRGIWEEMLPSVEHVPLGSDPAFAQTFAGAVEFPP